MWKVLTTHYFGEFYFIYKDVSKCKCRIYLGFIYVQYEYVYSTFNYANLKLLPCLPVKPFTVSTNILQIWRKEKKTIKYLHLAIVRLFFVCEYLKIFLNLWHIFYSFFSIKWSVVETVLADQQKAIRVGSQHHSYPN